MLRMIGASCAFAASTWATAWWMALRALNGSMRSMDDGWPSRCRNTSARCSASAPSSAGNILAALVTAVWRSVAASRPGSRSRWSVSAWAMGHHTFDSPYGTQAPSSTVTSPRSRRRQMPSSTRRLLPTPLSPTTLSTRPRSCCDVRSRAARAMDSSSARPTKPMSRRRRWRPPGGAVACSASHEVMVCSRPRACRSPAGSKRNVCDVRPWVVSPTSTPPGGAAACNRDARFTTSPMAV